MEGGEKMSETRRKCCECGKRRVLYNGQCKQCASKNTNAVTQEDTMTEKQRQKQQIHELHEKHYVKKNGNGNGKTEKAPRPKKEKAPRKVKQGKVYKLRMLLIEGKSDKEQLISKSGISAVAFHSILHYLRQHGMEIDQLETGDNKGCYKGKEVKA
jgi:hypothetical protein